MRHWIKTLGIVGGLGLLGSGLLGCEVLSQHSAPLTSTSQAQTSTSQTSTSETQPSPNNDRENNALQAEPLQAQPSTNDNQKSSAPQAESQQVQPSTQVQSSTKDYQKNNVLEVGSLSELKGDTTCQGTGGTLVYAETQHYQVYICGDKNDRLQPRYYRSRDRVGSGGINLEAKTYDPRQMRYFEFKNNGYSYILQMPSEQIPDPELNVELPNGKLIGEKVLRYLARP
jgi:hypothetical protein